MTGVASEQIAAARSVDLLSYGGYKHCFATNNMVYSERKGDSCERSDAKH